MNLPSFLISLVALAASASALTINTPVNVVQCQPIQFSWSGGTSPYYFSLIPGGQPSAAAIKQFPNQDGDSYTWLANLPSGTTFTATLKDSTGEVAFSDIVTIQGSSDSSCVNTAVQEGGTATPGTGNTSPSSTSSGTAGTSNGLVAAATTGGSSSSSSATTRSSTTSSGPSSASTNKNSATGNNVGTFGIAGLLGLVGAALF